MLKIREGVNLAKYTWFKVGGDAEYFVVLKTSQDLQDFLEYYHQNPQPIFILGAGSNLLIRDGGIRGYVVRLEGDFRNSMVVEDYTDEFVSDYQDQHLELIWARGGDLVINVASLAARNSLSGLEFLYTIPGSVGGAAKMNAGCYEDETANHCLRIRGLDLKSGELRTLTKEEAGFSYRRSDLPDDFVVTDVLFQVQPGDKTAINALMREHFDKRQATQPVHAKTAGSTFKNPPDNSAGRLLEQAGCKGMTVGGAQVSEMHCNFLINKNKATAADLEGLGEKMRKKVKDKFGIELEWEVKRVGEANV